MTKRIDKNIPVPPSRNYTIASTIRAMKVNDSILVDSPTAAGTVQQSMRRAGFKGTQRKTREGWRIWRIA